MSEVEDAGGPAFPMPGVLIESVSGILSQIADKKKRDDAMEQLGERATGMTMRDYFAAKALAAMIGKDGKDGANCGAGGVGNLTAFAYEYADAMLEARK